MPVEDALTRLQQAAAVRTRAEEEAQAIRDRAAAEFADAVVYALTEGGMKPKEVAEATDVSYETIRRIARARDIERLREPTVTSRKKAGEPGQS
ncbi:hypothetical protein ABZ312_09880 [Streptomyces sp. NPDC006207]